jgi:hypothetical protein
MGKVHLYSPTTASAEARRRGDGGEKSSERIGDSVADKHGSDFVSGNKTASGRGVVTETDAVLLFMSGDGYPHAGPGRFDLFR